MQIDENIKEETSKENSKEKIDNVSDIKLVEFESKEWIFCIKKW